MVISTLKFWRSVTLKFWRSVTLYVASAVMLVLFAYGAGRFYDGPIRECATGYCSTHGQPHTAADYRAYKAWEKTIFIVWPIGMVVLFLLQPHKPKGHGMTHPKPPRD